MDLFRLLLEHFSVQHQTVRATSTVTVRATSNCQHHTVRLIFPLYSLSVLQFLYSFLSIFILYSPFPPSSNSNLLRLLSQLYPSHTPPIFPSVIKHLAFHTPSTSSFFIIKIQLFHPPSTSLSILKLHLSTTHLFLHHQYSMLFILHQPLPRSSNKILSILHVFPASYVSLFTHLPDSTASASLFRRLALCFSSSLSFS